MSFQDIFLMYFIVRKPRHKPSHITQAYQSILRNPIVEHNNISVHGMWLKSKYSKTRLASKGAVQHIDKKPTNTPSKLEKNWCRTTVTSFFGSLKRFPRMSPTI